VRVRNNQAVGTSGSGFAISSGSNNLLANNRAVSSGVLFNGEIHGSNSANGLQITNLYADPKKPDYCPTTNGHATGNVVGWRGGDHRSDFYFEPQASKADEPSNTKLPNPINQDTEITEFASWRKKLSDNDIPVGAPLRELNLITNAGFEEGNNNWSNLGGATAEASNHHSGAYAMRITSSKANSGRNQRIGLIPNTRYTLSGWGKVSVAGEQGQIRLECHDAAGKLVEAQTLDFSTTAYEEKSIVFTTPKATRFCNVSGRKSGGRGDFFADDLSLI
jgi:parallel beta-helix repeat protein